MIYFSMTRKNIPARRSPRRRHAVLASKGFLQTVRNGRIKTMGRYFQVGMIPTVLFFCAVFAQAAEPRSFYDGKTINLIISTSPGGATDVAGRLVSRYLGKYIPGHPNIMAQNMAGAGGIVRQTISTISPSRTA